MNNHKLGWRNLKIKTKMGWNRATQIYTGTLMKSLCYSIIWDFLWEKENDPEYQGEL